MMKNTKIKPKPFSSREDVIWAAGLFEGEGWISIQGKTPAIGIQMADKDILEKFAHAVGAGNIYYKKPKIYDSRRIKSKKPQWAWRVTGFQRVQAILVYMWSWLGMRRRARTKEVLGIAKTGRTKPGMPLGYKYSKAICGDVRKYWQGCHCELCRKANRDYSKRIRKTVKQDDSAFYLPGSSSCPPDKQL